MIDAWDEKLYQRRESKRVGLRTNAVFQYEGANYSNSATANATRSVRGASYRDVPANQDPALRRFKSIETKEEVLGFRIVVPVELIASLGEQK